MTHGESIVLPAKTERLNGVKHRSLILQCPGELHEIVIYSSNDPELQAHSLSLAQHIKRG